MGSATVQHNELFDKTLLEELDFSSSDINTKHNLSATNPGENLVMRSLCQQDFNKGYIELLSQLTKVGDVTQEMFNNRYTGMKACPNTYYIVVVEDVELSRVISNASLIVEQHLNSKLQLVKKGRIEDVVVSDSHRGKRLGLLLLETLILLSKHVGCSEMSLECKDSVVDFYSRFGFEVQDELKYMTRRISS